MTVFPKNRGDWARLWFVTLVTVMLAVIVLTSWTEFVWRGGDPRFGFAGVYRSVLASGIGKTLERFGFTAFWLRSVSGPIFFLCDRRLGWIALGIVLFCFVGVLLPWPALN